MLMPVPTHNLAISDISFASISPMIECSWDALKQFPLELQSAELRDTSAWVFLSQWSGVESAIEHLEGLEDDWDGYGGARISDEAIKKAKTFINLFSRNLPAPEVMPHPNGTVSLEWEVNNKLAYLELGATRYAFYLKIGKDIPVMLDGLNDEAASNNIALLIRMWLFMPRPLAVSSVTNISFAFPKHGRAAA